MEVSPLLGHALASAINEDRHVPMLEAAIRWMARALEANEPLIREMVHKKANWALKLAGLDAKLADAILDGLRKLTVEMSTDPAHPVRVKVEEALAQLANDLQTRPETRARVLEVARRLNYQPNQHARALATNRSYLIGIVVPDLMNLYFAEVAHAIESVAFTLPEAAIIHQYHVIVIAEEIFGVFGPALDTPAVPMEI
jgi:uncharacterized membrane-anchored protein YjiN (DUF445 family)